MKSSTWLLISCLTGTAAIAACSSSTSTSGTQATSDGGTGGLTATAATATGTSSSSSGATTTSGTGGASTSSSSATTTTTGTGGAAGVVNGCDPASTSVSTGNVTVTFPSGAAPAQYSPACVKVHEGSMVTWNGSFADHPLTPDGTSNPIMSTSIGTTASFTFAAAGSFGFHCNVHPTLMLGAVFVVP